MVSLITRDELQAGIERGDVIVLDALPASYYEQQHLPGARNLVEDEVDSRAGELLPDKAAAIVTYCSNAQCGNSEAVGNRLIQLGYSNVRKYRDGVQDWVEAGLPVESGADVSTPEGAATA